MAITMTNPGICDTEKVKVFDLVVTDATVVNTDQAFTYGGALMSNFDSTPDVKIVRNSNAAASGGAQSISFYLVDRFGFHCQTTAVAPGGGTSQTFRCVFFSKNFFEF